MDKKGVINVKTLGAIGDGISDDTLILQKILSDAQDSTIFFPSGRYQITAPLQCFGNIDKESPRCLMLGSGDAAIVAGASMEQMLHIENANYTQVDNLLFDGKDQATTGIHVTNSNGVNFNRIKVCGIKTGVLLDLNTAATVRDCVMRGNVCIDVGRDSTANILDNDLYMWADGVAVRVQSGAYSVTVDNNTINAEKHNGIIGVDIIADDKPIYDTHIRNNEFQGIKICVRAVTKVPDQIFNTIVTANHIIKMAFDGPKHMEHTCQMINFQNVTNAIISHNFINCVVYMRSNTDDPSILLTQCKNPQVAYNTIANLKTSAIVFRDVVGGIVVGNVIRNTAQKDPNCIIIDLQKGSNFNQINGNLLVQEDESWSRKWIINDETNHGNVIDNNLTVG